MPEPTETVKTAEEKETRLNELSEKQDRTEEEKTEFNTLRKEKDDATAKTRIEELNTKTRDAENRALEAETRASETEKRLKDIEDRPSAPVINKETVDADGKSFYTDVALTSQIKAGTMTETEAYGHQQDRIAAIASQRAYDRIKGEQVTTAKETALKQEVSDMYAKYPQWDQKHRDHNPNDPLFATASGLFKDGLSPVKAMKTAEKLHGVTKDNPDRSEELGALSPTAPGITPKSEKLPDLEEWEKDNAYRTWRDLINPKTGRNFTQAEAELKAQKARSVRPQRSV